MKKLSLAIVLLTVSVTFANAQSKEVQKQATTETTEVAQLIQDTVVPTTKADVVRAEEAKMETMPVEQANSRRDPATEQQKATIKRNEAKKAESMK